MTKKILSVLGVIVAIIIIGLAVIGNKASGDAGDYNDKLITKDEEILTAFENLDAQFGNNSTDLEKERLDIVALVQKNTADVKALSAPKLGDEGFRESLLQMFDLYKKWAEKDYKELVDIYSAENPSEVSLSKADELYVQMEKEEAPLLEKINMTQGSFAKKYNFELE